MSDNRKKVSIPKDSGTFNGEIKKTGYSGASSAETYWRWNGSEWTQLKGSGGWRPLADIKNEYKSQQEALANGATLEEMAAKADRYDDAIVVKASAIPPSSVTATTQNALRYPDSAPITNSHDYVTFQFYKYAPPFRKREREVATVNGKTITGKEEFGAGLYDYNQASKSENQYKKLSGAPPIVLYMPEDISTGFRANWTGKAFGNFASDFLRSAGADGLVEKLEGVKGATWSGINRFIPIKGAQALSKIVKKVGGDTISNDDIFGGISGAILNPNVELMYGGGDLRNFSLNFRLVPRDKSENNTINEICNQFKRAMLPKLDPGDVMGGTSKGTFAGFIGVPDLCRVAFMHGGDEHDALPRFKMCAITQVDVNYTPDGAYATYYDGQPVAVQLTVSFQETKLVFSEEIGGKGGIR
tara:strand:- start:212 stop:1456 length:1245 start_codon:yes stop_codon:yes gene_type:complete